MGLQGTGRAVCAKNQGARRNIVSAFRWGLPALRFANALAVKIINTLTDRKIKGRKIREIGDNVNN